MKLFNNLSNIRQLSKGGRRIGIRGRGNCNSNIDSNCNNSNSKSNNRSSNNHHNKFLVYPSYSFYTALENRIRRQPQQRYSSVVCKVINSSKNNNNNNNSGKVRTLPNITPNNIASNTPSTNNTNNKQNITQDIDIDVKMSQVLPHVKYQKELLSEIDEIKKSNKDNDDNQIKYQIKIRFNEVESRICGLLREVTEYLQRNHPELPPIELRIAGGWVRDKVNKHNSNFNLINLYI